MQRGVLERWIDSLAERQFDTPFMLLLRANGFYDIHFTHGSYEFGKDFIAKKIESGEPRQYGFQTKAGDISGSEWSAIHSQIEELVASWLVHPNYDASLPQEHRLVTTGALKGKAILSAKQFRERLLARHEGNFAVWERENLLDMLQEAPEAAAAYSAIVEQLIAAATTGSLTRSSLSKELDKFVPQGKSIDTLRETLLQNSLLIAHLLAVGRPFYAVRAAYHSARTALSVYVDSLSEESRLEYFESLLFSVQLGIHHAHDLAKLDPIELAQLSGGPVAQIAAYPLTCFSILECLGLGVLAELWRGNEDNARSLSEELLQFVARNPGCAHPLSDRFAASLVPAAVALAAMGEMEAGRGLLRRITKWVCDQMESGLGLASPYSTEKEEVERIFGSCFDFVDYPVRRDSLFAVVLADLCWTFFPDTYPVVVNELKAVGAIPSVVHPLDTSDSLFLNSRSTQALINLDYPDTTQEATSLEHHLLQEGARSIERLGGPLAPMICGSLCQDRVFTDTFPRLIRALNEGWGLKTDE